MRFVLELVRDSILARDAAGFGVKAGLGDMQLLDIYAGIGLAGTGYVAREALENWTHPFAGAWFEGDGYTAYLGAFGGGEGGIVIAGTGSIGITLVSARPCASASYGLLVSDDGSGADIGLLTLSGHAPCVLWTAAETPIARSSQERHGPVPQRPPA